MWGGALSARGGAADRARVPLPRLPAPHGQRVRDQLWIERRYVEPSGAAPRIVTLHGGHRTGPRRALLRRLQHDALEPLPRAARRHAVRARGHARRPRVGRARRAHLHAQQAAVARAARGRARVRGDVRRLRGGLARGAASRASAATSRSTRRPSAKLSFGCRIPPRCGADRCPSSTTAAARAPRTRRSSSSTTATRSRTCARAASAAETRGESFELVAGSVLVGHPGDEYVCTHDHAAGGDECLSFALAPELVESLGGAREVWRTGGVPPLPELVVLGELAQATAEQRTDLGLDEVGLWFAARFVELVSGVSAPRPRCARRRPPPRGGGGALARRARARGDRSRARGARGGALPVPLPAPVLARARRDAAPVSRARAAAPRGAPALRRASARSPTWRSRSASPTSRTSCARSTAPPASRRAASAAPRAASARFSKIGSRAVSSLTSNKEVWHVRSHRSSGEGSGGERAVLPRRARAARPRALLRRTRRARASAPAGATGLWLALALATRASAARTSRSRAANRAAVERFYKEGLAAGGRDNGAPGLRADYGPSYFAAFLVDPDGNNVEAVCLAQEK